MNLRFRAQRCKLAQSDRVALCQALFRGWRARKNVPESLEVIGVLREEREQELMEAVLVRLQKLCKRHLRAARVSAVFEEVMQRRWYFGPKQRLHMERRWDMLSEIP